MNTIRAFIAVEITGQARQRISELVTSLKKSNADAKWITEDQTHLTLKFLGDIDENSVPKISDALSDIPVNFKPFKINFSGIGGFPGLSHPSIVWLGVGNGAEYLETLNNSIEISLEKLSFKKENRPFKPHLTLARIKSDKNLSSLIKSIKEINTGLDLRDDIKIDRVTLFQSILNPKGATYKVILEKYLQKSY